MKSKQCQQSEKFQEISFSVFFLFFSFTHDLLLFDFIWVFFAKKRKECRFLKEVQRELRNFRSYIKSFGGWCSATKQKTFSRRRSYFRYFHPDRLGAYYEKTSRRIEKKKEEKERTCCKTIKTHKFHAFFFLFFFLGRFLADKMPQLFTTYFFWTSENRTSFSAIERI